MRYYIIDVNPLASHGSVDSFAFRINKFQKSSVESQTYSNVCYCKRKQLQLIYIIITELMLCPLCNDEILYKTSNKDEAEAPANLNEWKCDQSEMETPD